MKRDLIFFVQDIFDSIEKIEEFIGGKTEEDFYEDIKSQDAIIRRLEIIGEATKNIPEDFKNKYPNIPWKKIAGMRDVLIHAYFGVNLERIWEIIEKDLLKLKENIEKILKNEKRK